MTLFGIIDTLSSVALRHSKERADSTESSALVEYESKMTALSTCIDMQVKDMNEFLAELKINNKSLQDTITKQFAQYTAHVTKCLSGLQNLIRIIKDGESNNQVVATGSRGESLEQSAEERGIKRPRV